MVVLDTSTGRSVASVKSKSGSDGIQYDTRRRLVFVSCGEGYIELIRQDDPDHYMHVASVPTRAGAGTSLFVPELDRLYLAVPQAEGRPAEIRIFGVAASPR